MIKQRINPRDQIAAAVRGRVLAGEFGPGAHLPSIRELAGDYRAATGTVHAALRILAAEGLVILRERKGAIVALPQQSIAGRHERLARSHEGGLFRPSEVPEILRAELTTETPPDALAAFGLAEDAELGLREYLVRCAGTVVTYGASYIHPEIWGQVAELRAPAPIPDGIIGAVRRVLGRNVVAVPGPHKADYATSEEAEHLGVPDDSPVLVEVTSCIADDGSAVEWNMSVHPARYWVSA